MVFFPRRDFNFVLQHEYSNFKPIKVKFIKTQDFIICLQEKLTVFMSIYAATQELLNLSNLKSTSPVTNRRSSQNDRHTIALKSYTQPTYFGNCTVCPNQPHLQKPARNFIRKVSIISRKIHFLSKSCAHASEVNGAHPMLTVPLPLHLKRLQRWICSAAEEEREKKREEAHKHQLNLLSRSRGVSLAHTRERNHNHYKQ